MHFVMIDHRLDKLLPLIYMWEIHTTEGSLIGRYVGKAKSGANRPLKHYTRNVANILADKAYRKGNPTGFRRVHHALAEAHRTGLRITLQFLCNVAPHENINHVEQLHIRLHDCSGGAAWQLNGARLNKSVDAGVTPAADITAPH